MIEPIPNNEHPALRRLLNSSVCILCARPQEAEGIASALKCTETLYGHNVPEVDDSHTFHFGSLKLKDGNSLGFYVTHASRQSVQTFIVDASILFYILRPRFVLHAGVCAGYRDPKGEHKLADVIFADAAFNYEEGKYTKNENGKIEFHPDFDKVSIPTNMSGFADTPKHPNYHYGDLITGAAVRGDAPFVFEKIRKGAARKVIGLDMEASAFLKLCTSTYFSQGTHKLHCLGVVKGISDFGDERKDEDQQHSGGYDTALKNTGAAIGEWLQSRIPAVTWTPSYGHEPAAPLASIYFVNFVQVVCQSIATDLPLSSKTDECFHADAKAIHGLKIIMPPNLDPLHYKNYHEITSVVKDHNILNVNVGGGRYTRDLYYKHGYLIDFPRTINDLSRQEDRRYQAEIFARLMNAHEQFQSSGIGKRPFAEICSWESFKEWLDREAKEERSKDELAASASDARYIPNGRLPSPPSGSSVSPGKDKKVSRKKSFPFNWSLGRKSSRSLLGRQKNEFAE